MGKKRLKKLFDKKEKKLSIYLTAGYPVLDAMPKLVEVLEQEGVDFIEAGMPYSDPLADGETIQKSSAKALKNGMNLDLYFKQIREIRKFSNIPILFMGYFNQVLKRGMDNFLQECVDSGIDGLIIPDLSPEIYMEKYVDTFDKYDLGISFLISPTTPDERIRMIDNLTSGFIYAVSTSATTGKKGEFGDEHKAYFERIKQLNLKNPVVIGFGIDNQNKFLMANRYADAAIIGSAFIKAIKNENDFLKKAKLFVREIKV